MAKETFQRDKTHAGVRNEVLDVNDIYEWDGNEFVKTDLRFND